MPGWAITLKGKMSKQNIKLRIYLISTLKVLSANDVLGLITPFATYTLPVAIFGRYISKYIRQIIVIKKVICPCSLQ